MYIIVEAVKLDKEYSDSLKFDYNVVKTNFNDLPSQLKGALDIIVPEGINGDKYVIAPVISHCDFSSNTKFDVVAGFNNMDDAISYCKTKNTELLRTFGYTISVSEYDETGSCTQVLHSYVRFMSYNDVAEPYLLKSGRALLNVKEGIVKINEEGEENGEQSGREEGKEGMEETGEQTGCCGCGSTGAD
ncbi:hypothetical protein [Bacteroides acidifaciens]|uniref:hypothetical protein n=1 Tax=Bacteroides acidifaciens TaxID=85831 RepID=UPI00263A54DB|nr:hypothetical protein [Bacteroides acidifaciens]